MIIMTPYSILRVFSLPHKAAAMQKATFTGNHSKHDAICDIKIMRQNMTFHSPFTLFQAGCPRSGGINDHPTHCELFDDAEIHQDKSLYVTCCRLRL